MFRSVLPLKTHSMVVVNGDIVSFVRLFPIQLDLTYDFFCEISESRQNVFLFRSHSGIVRSNVRVSTDLI